MNAMKFFNNMTLKIGCLRCLHYKDDAKNHNFAAKHTDLHSFLTHMIKEIIEIFFTHDFYLLDKEKIENVYIQVRENQIIMNSYKN